MPLVQLNTNPTERQLKQFGLIAAIALPALAWLWGGDRPVIFAMAGVGASLGFVGLLQPRLLRWLFVGLTVVLLPIGLVVGEVVLALTYYGVLLPIGLIFRLLARDRLQLKCDRAADSYWRPKPKPRDLGSYLRQS